MGREDYVKGATSKIFNSAEKKAVEYELNDHILETQNFIEDIGYNPDDAENKAVERMGEYEEIAEQLGELHSDFYNPVGDIIGFVIWLASLGGLYYLLKEYIFNDIGTVPITLCAVCIIMAMFFVGCSVMLNRNRLPVILGTLFCGGGTSAFIYFCTKNINGIVNGKISNLKDLIFNGLLPSSVTNQNKDLILIAVIGFSALAILMVTTSLIYYIKYHLSANTLFDNHFRKYIKYFSYVIAVCFIACAVFCGIRFFAIQDGWYNEYKVAYESALDMSTKCKTFDDVCDYVTSNQLDLRDNAKMYELTDENGNLTGYEYSDNLVYFCVENNETPEDSEYAMGEYGLTTVGSEDDYSENYYYQMTLLFTVGNDFKNKIDSISLSKFKTSEEELDEIVKFDMEKHTEEEILKFYNTHLPNSFNYSSAKSKNRKGAYTFKYVAGKGKYKYTREFNVNIYTEKYLKELKALDDKAKEITEIVKNNLSCSYEEIARLTNSKLIKPDISYEEYEKSLSYLGTFFDDYKESMLASYENNYEFAVSDDLVFKLSPKPYTSISFTYYKSKTIYLRTYALTEEGKYYSYSDEPFKKMYVNDGLNVGYYAKNKLPYSYDTVPYFEKDGTRYMLYSKNIDPGDNSGYIKEYYLASQKGNSYNCDICYVDKNGYLYFDTGNRLQKQSDNLTYKDSSGNVYTKALETSWDENGNVLPFKAED